MSPREPEGGDGERTPDYTDPTVPGAATDEERPDVNPRETAETGDTRPADEADPDSPTDETWEGDTLIGPGPGS